MRRLISTSAQALKHRTPNARLSRTTKTHSIPAVTSAPAAFSPGAYGASTTHADRQSESLRELIDSPTNSTLLAAGTGVTGLFGQPALTHPEAFLSLAQSTTLRAEIIVQRIVADGARHRESVFDTVEELELAFKQMVKNLDRLSDLLCGVIDMAELVRNAHPDPKWSHCANEGYEALCAYMNELNTDVALYESLNFLYHKLPAETPHKSLELFSAYAVAIPFLRDFEKSGIQLAERERNQFVQLSTRTLQLGRVFSQNLTEPSAAPVLLRRGQIDPYFSAAFVTKIFGGATEAMVDPTSWAGRMLARQHPSEDVRRMMYVAAHTSPPSHVQVLEDILATRATLARLVGRETWGDVTLEDKMAKTPANVMSFLKSLSAANRPLASADLAILERMKAQTLHMEHARPVVHAWDRDFYSELVASASPTVPDVSAYFSVGACFEGLSKLFTRLYGIRFEMEDVQPGETWDPQVRKLRVIDEDEGRIGTIYCDLFARRGKQSGAAHYTVRCSRRLDDDDLTGEVVGATDGNSTTSGSWLRPDTLLYQNTHIPAEDVATLQVTPVTYNGRPGTYQEPLVVLVCGFESASARAPAFLRWHEVETLFHEMGHAIHSMIGRTEYHNVAGTRCATDFVELPSILMEHFVAAPEVLGLFAKHHATRKPLPAETITQLLQERLKFSALETTSQIMMAALDQRYHSITADATDFDSTRVLQDVQNTFHVIPYAPGTTWQTQFGHLLGYGATYYAYLFDRAIAARVYNQVFAADPLARDAGEVFKSNLLMWGGGRDPWDMVGTVVGDPEVAQGGEGAMRIVGQWGIESEQAPKML